MNFITSIRSCFIIVYINFQMKFQFQIIVCIIWFNFSCLFLPFSASTMMRFVIFSCLVAQALSACFTPENFNCRDFTGTFPDPRDCGQSFVQVISSNVFNYVQNFYFHPNISYLSSCSMDPTTNSKKFD